MITTIIVFIITLGILVLVHESGHFLAARFFKIGVKEFAIGFPPRIFKWVSKKTNIAYALGWLPLGGYVQIAGEDKTLDEDRKSKEDGFKDDELFYNKPLWQRLVVLFGGVFMNFVFAVILFSIIAGLYPYETTEQNTLDPNAKVQIQGVSENSPAKLAELMPGDIIVSINNQKITNQVNLINTLDNSKGEKIEVVYERAGEVGIKSLNLSSDKRMGVSIATIIYNQTPWYELPYYGVKQAVFMTKEMLVGLYGLIAGIFSTTSQVEGGVAGPVGIAVLTGEVWKMGILPFLNFMAILSLNLFLVNVLPLPALDGGRIVVAVLDKFFKGKWTLQSQARVHQIGFIVLLGLIFALTVNDIFSIVS